MFNPKLKVVFSGIQPSGNLHLGNYLGAITQWVELQEKFNCMFCVVDYHAITVKQDPKRLQQKIIETTKIYLAAGINPKNSIIFQQSQIPAHTELAWILNCTAARIADLNKMTQFKDKAGANQESVSVGLYDYPVLMAADILLYQTEVVPVGEDQKQHVELARDLARRFNRRFGETFVVPEVKILSQGARIMALDNPTKKMSKSAKSEYNRIELLEDPKKAAKKIMRAVTDTGKEIKYNPTTKPGISNLLAIYTLLGQRSIAELEKQYQNKGYGELKKDLAQLVQEFLSNFQAKYRQINDQEVKRILEQGRQQAAVLAEKTLQAAKEKVGLII